MLFSGFIVGDRLFGRVSRLVVGELDLSNLDIQGKCVKSLRPEPNTLDLAIFNLKQESRDYLQGSAGGVAKGVKKKEGGGKKGFLGGKTTARFEIGYKDAALHQIFLGEIRYAYSQRVGPEIITHLSTGDGDKAIQTSRCAVTFGAQVPAETALRAIVTTLGIPTGNLDLAVSRLKTRGLLNLYPKGGAAYGSSWDELKSFARSADLEISIQDGALQILDRGVPLEGLAVRIAPDSGLLDSPQVDADGTVTATCRIIPALRPGCKVAFDTEDVTGGYRVVHCQWDFDTRGDDWNITIACRKY